MNLTRKNDRKRILCIADLPNWIFNRHITYLQRFLSDEFEILTAFRGQAFDEDDYDLIYPLEFMLLEPGQMGVPRKCVTGIRSFISWANWEFIALTEHLRTRFQRVHVVSQELYEIFKPYLPDVALMTHGVDMDLFSPGQPAESEPGRLRLGWAGNRNTHIKGYWDYIHPLGQLPGVELVICGYKDGYLTLEEMPGFYNSIDAYVCASSFEGSNNSLLEAAAMERAIVTTPVGTVPEYLIDHESAIIVERDLEQFTRAVLELRDQPELRLKLGKRARQSLIEKGWDWRHKAEEYRQFFRDAIQGNTAPDVSGDKPLMPTEHLFNVLQTQNRLLRELEIGDTVRIYDLGVEIANLKKEKQLLQTELEDIRASETYAVLERIKANKVMQTTIGLYNRLRKRKS